MTTSASGLRPIVCPEGRSLTVVPFFASPRNSTNSWPPLPRLTEGPVPMWLRMARATCQRKRKMRIRKRIFSPLRISAGIGVSQSSEREIDVTHRHRIPGNEGVRVRSDQRSVDERSVRRRKVGDGRSLIVANDHRLSSGEFRDGYHDVAL